MKNKKELKQSKLVKKRDTGEVLSRICDALVENTTKEKILKAMYDLVAELGYEKASISMICERVGIKKPSIYYYFHSKEELFLAVFENMVFNFEPSGFHFDMTHKEYEVFLINLGCQFLDSYKEDERIPKLMAELYLQSRRIESVHQKMLEYNKEYLEEVLWILEEGQKIDFFKPETDFLFLAQKVINVLLGMESSMITYFDFDYHRIWRDFIKGMINEYKQEA